MRHTCLLIVAALATAAGPVLAQQPDSARRNQAAPASHGTLTQDDVSVRLGTDELSIRFVPLDEDVLRLLAPDAYRSLHALRVSRADEVDEVARRRGITEPGVALVTFFGQRPGARFDPQLLTVGARGRSMQPIGIVPITPVFGSHQLEQRQAASAIFVYHQLLPTREPMTVSYGVRTSGDWERKLPRLERERARVSARERQAGMR